MTLRLLHTSDWHLGRTLHEAALLEDQRWVLGRLLEALRDTRPDALVIAGDVYDRAVPAADAVEVLDWVLTEVRALGIPVIAIAGNHDSPERLSFGARLLAPAGVHLRGGLDRVAEPVPVAGKGLVYALPFVDPDVARGLLGDETLRGHPAATARLVGAARAHAAATAAGLPTVLVGHAFVQGAAETPDSERPLSVGTAGSVPAETLAGFDYVALGHLHAPQEVAPGVRYSGSLLKYSFAEADHRKAALLVEVARGAPPLVEPIALGQRRDVVRLAGTLQQLLADPAHERHRGDLVEATLDDEGYVLDARGKLQQRFPHVLNVVLRSLSAGGTGSYSSRVAGAGGDDQALFKAFLETVAGAVPTEAEAACFAAALDAVAKRERGA